MGDDQSVVSRRGVTLRRSTIDSSADPSVEFEIESASEVPMAVRIHDMPPVGSSLDDLRVHRENGSNQWRSTGNHLELSVIVAPNESIVAGYSALGADTNRLRFHDEPMIDAVQPVDPKAVDGSDAGLLWRSAASVPIDRPMDEQQEATIDPASPEGPTADSVASDNTVSGLLPVDSNVTPVLSVVMPTLNEEDGIGECIDAVVRAVERLGTTAEIIVSDSSSDRTPEIAREKGAIVVEPDRKGYGHAYRYAFQFARGEYIAMGDADMTYDFEDLSRLLEVIENGSDIAMGSRLAGTIEPGAMPPLHRYIGNPLLTKFLNVFYGADVSDAHSGLRMFRRETLDQLDLRTNGMEFASEMIMEAGARDLRIEEVPITYHKRRGEATLSSFKDGWRHVRFMLANAPGYLFSTPGVVFGVLGVTAMTLAFFNIAPQDVSIGIHSMIAGSLLTIVGHQMVSLGIFSTAAGNPISTPDDPLTTLIVERVSLERGAAIGLLAFIAGATYTIYLLRQWISSGFTNLPLLPGDIAAFTAIVLGIQIVLYSFFMDTVKQQ